jgi:protein SCO1/2
VNRRSALIVLSFGIAVPALGEPAGRQRTDRVNAGWPLDDFAVVDQHGHPFTRENLLGKWTFVVFGDTHCGEACTDSLTTLAGMRQRIAGTPKAKTTQVVFVSMGGDSAAQLREYLGPIDKSFLGVTGERQTLAQLAEDLGIAQASAEHAGAMALIHPDAVVWGQFLPPFEVTMLTARYLKTRGRR